MNTQKSANLKQKLIDFLHSELFSYLFFGVCTTIINIVTFQLFYSLMNVPTLISNAIAWVFSVAFAYITNRTFVFHSNENTAKGILREISAFVGARLFSLLFDEIIMWLMVDVMGYTAIERLTAQILNMDIQDAKSLIAKVCANVVVMILNFLFSKLFIFKKK